MKAELRKQRRCRRAFTLLEIIGVLAVIVILALVLAPVLIRQMDSMAGDAESARLRVIGDAFATRVMRTRSVDTNWAINVAAELGVDVANVLTNARSQPRYFLIDPQFRIGNNSSTLPYTQTNWASGSINTDLAGNTTAPINPRIIVLSSIGQRLPSLTAYPNATDFNAIWDWNDVSGAVPGASILASFTRGDDLKVQRINLSPFFVRLSLTTTDSAIPRYSIDSTNWATAYGVAVGGGIDGYFIKGSVLTLYNEGLGANPGLIDSRQILNFNNSFVYNQHKWRPSIIGNQSIGGLDITDVVDKFLKAAPNLNSHVPNTTNQQRVIVQNMLAYIQAYTNWAVGGTFPPGGLKTTARNSHDTLIASVRGIFENGGGLSDYTPMNNTACTNSP